MAAGVTIIAASCSRDDVQKAIDACPEGGTVLIPAGNATWTSGINLGSKSLTLQGAGIGNTNITSGTSGSQEHLLSFTQGSNEVRITGISFIGGTYDRRMISASGSAYSGNPYRIDHCSFLSTVSTVFIDNFSACGLIDHNEFYAPDNSEMIYNFGDGVAGWSEDIIPGSPAALYVENNTFTNNNTGQYFYGCSAIQSYNGARVVFRYNFLDFVQVDVHGTPGMIGARWFEIYENTFNIPSRALGGGQDKYMDLRAGSGVVFNNHKTGISSNASIVLHEEDSGYPALYQIGRGINQKSSPVYLWGNDSTMSIVSGSSNVVAGRDFYVSASQPATMQRQETSSDNSSTSYTYIAFTYPYPLDANAYPYPLAGNAYPNPSDANALVAPTLTLHTDSGTTGDGITNVGRVDVSGLASGAPWQYSTDGGAHWINGNGTSFTLSGDGLKNVIARQTDAAGNTSGNSLTLSFILDTTAPAAPTLALHTDSGTPGDGITNVGRVRRERAGERGYVAVQHGCRRALDQREWHQLHAERRWFEERDCAADRCGRQHLRQLAGAELHVGHDDAGQRWRHDAGQRWRHDDDKPVQRLQYAGGD